MLPILGLFGLALAAALWPDSETEPTDTDTEAAPEKAKTEVPEAADLLNASDAASEDDVVAKQDDFVLLSAAEGITGTSEDDVLSGSEADDRMSGSAGSDTLLGGDGDDILYGDDDAEGDELIGGHGNDILHAGGGDYLHGGAGDDEFRLEEDEPVFIADYSPDDDKIILEYDPTAPLPVLETQEMEDGIGLFADSKHVATFGGILSLDVKDVHLVPEAA